MSSYGIMPVELFIVSITVSNLSILLTIAISQPTQSSIHSGWPWLLSGSVLSEGGTASLSQSSSQ